MLYTAFLPSIQISLTEFTNCVCVCVFCAFFVTYQREHMTFVSGNGLFY